MEPTYLFRKPSFVMMSDLEGKYRLKIAKGLNMDKEYLFIVLNKMEAAGLLRKEKKGRICLIYLTEKGKEIQDKLRLIYTLLYQ